MNCPTPHIKASAEDFAKTVLMPGDPKRSSYIADNFLSDAVLVNDVRGVQGYTGTYQGHRVSVMASGMGIPSIGIYSWELFSAFDVDNIIRIGSIGAIQNNINLRDVIIAMASSTDSNYSTQFKLPGTIAPTADYRLLKTAVDCAGTLNIKYHVGNVLSSDLFYNVPSDDRDKWASMEILGFEMETAALYLNAAKFHKHALGLFTVSDQLVKNEFMSADERQTSFNEMITLALDTAVSLDNAKGK